VLLVDDLVDQIRRVRSAMRRATVVPALVRGGVFLATLAALFTAYPSEIVAGRGLIPLAAVAALPALAPRGALPALAALVAIAGWGVTTVAFAEPVTFWRLTALASSLYVAHSLAALAAVLPYDAIVEPEVLARWLSRALLVAAASAALGGALLVGAVSWGGEPLLVASLLGLAVAVGLTALLGWLLRRA
jgi:hypothetical protein